ncbi:hypothetical protein [Chromobacterium violaceum]|uniref:hypothetical protein n=1 Tax=Chromobacterium violaceum TaxID=536 RepID=UPI001CE0C936|nr:hypothetical protein [Chromobacterium violaceum]
MRIGNVLAGLEEAGEALLGQPVEASTMGLSHAQQASGWPCHPSGYGGWDWERMLFQDRWSSRKHLVQASVGGQMFAALRIKIDGGDKCTIRYLASDPGYGIWNRNVTKMVFFGMRVANVAAGLTMKELIIDAPAPGLLGHYETHAKNAGFTLHPASNNSKITLLF